MPAGRPSKYDALIQEAADYYVDNPEEFDDIVPSVVGLALAINVSETTIYNWATEDNPEFLGTLQRCKAKQQKMLLNGGLSNTFNAAITKLMLANHGYSDKQEQTLQGPGGGAIELDMEWQVEVIEPEGD